MTQSYETVLLVSTGIVLTKPRAGLEVLEWVTLGHTGRLGEHPALAQAKFF
jgi:hypothetical protein